MNATNDFITPIKKLTDNAKKTVFDGTGKTYRLMQELLDIMQFIIAPIIIGSGIDSIKLKSISSLKNALRPKSHLYKLGDEMIASLEF